MATPRLDDPALLGRAELVDDLAPALEPLRGRRVLITGAAGSIGRVLADALLAAGDIELTLLDHHEHSLFTLQRALGDAGARRATYALADVRDADKLRRVVRRARPDLIFHLAAFKHVHYGELFPEEAVGVNVLATRSLLEVAAEAGVERVVYPSSDKAVDPPSLYGATKRIAEVLVQAAALRGHAYTALRYMNVLGTRGSVLETFAAQLCAGEPLTVTDPAMTRYWISPREAAWLAFEAAAADGGSLLLLDVREEIPVMEMAARLARLSGQGDGHPITVTGARPGERLREQIVGANEVARSGPRPGLLRIEHPGAADHASRVGDLVEELAALVREADAASLRDATMRAARLLQ